MPREVIEPFRTLYCDPGEDFGWALGRGTRLLAAGTEKMYDMRQIIWDSLNDEYGAGWLAEPDAGGFLREEALDELNVGPGDCHIGRIVCENFRIYPWAAKRLAWNEVRTARVIGAIDFMCDLKGIPFILQGAKIKAAAVAAGAEELYYHPLHENRHQNDAIQHFVFFTRTELMHVPLPVPKEETADD